MCSSDVFLGVLALLFPPIAVWVKCGVCSADSLINLLLCMLGLVPGLLHAWYIIAKYPEPTWEYETVAPAAHSGGSGAHNNNHLYYDPERFGARHTNNQNAGVTYVFVRDDGTISNHAAAAAGAPHHDARYAPQTTVKHYDSSSQPQKSQKGQKGQQQGQKNNPRVYGSMGNSSGSGAAGSSSAATAGSASAESTAANVGEENVPPSYAEAIGDHKVQRHE